MFNLPSLVHPPGMQSREMTLPKVWKQSGWHDYLAARNAQLPYLPSVTQLSPAVVRILGGNPGDMQLQGTNTYLVGSGRERILIDTGQGFPIWLTTLSSFLDQHRLSISHVLLTHCHSDHTGGLPTLLTKYPHLTTAVFKAHPERGQYPIREGQIFSTQGATLRALFTPGHSHDHMCLVFEGNGAMFTGDHVLGHGSSVVVEDLARYMKSLQMMKQTVHAGEITVGFPGHGAVIKDLPAKLAVYSRHWETRQKVVLSALESTSLGVKGYSTTREITTYLYGVTLSTMAQPLIAQVLEKLAEEGKVRSTVIAHEERWFL